MKSVKPGPVEGQLSAPPSKSVFQRSVAIATLARGTSEIITDRVGDDGHSALRIARALGARIDTLPDRVRITGGRTPTGDPLDCGESGLALRMFAALAALGTETATLTARGSLQLRPVGILPEALRGLGARFHSQDGLPPLIACGPLRGGRLEVDGRLSSQFLTGLLIALPCCREDSEVGAVGLVSKPYVRLTIRLLQHWGVHIDHGRALERFWIRGNQRPTATSMVVDGDWSGAAMMLVAGALAGSVRISGLDADSPQADRAIVDALRAAGAGVDLRARDRSVAAYHRPLDAFNFDARHCPDLFPPLVALALGCRGTSELIGVTRLRHKESDRAAALTEEFARLGGQIRLEGDRMLIRGGMLHGGTVGSRGDHRIAMATAVAALDATAPVSILGARCVAKSYPAFFDDLRAIGAEVRHEAA